MTEEIIIAGFGGQGVLLSGKLLAYAGIVTDKEVSWIPSYGPEMRGGTANVTVIVSENRISSPILNDYSSAILLNQQSVDKFTPKVRSGGVLLYDSNGTHTPPTREDINIYKLDATQAAVDMGNARVFNAIILGAYLTINPIFELEAIVESMKQIFNKNAQKLIPLNEAALKKGRELIQG